MDSDTKWEILRDILLYFNTEYSCNAHVSSFLMRHEYIILHQYPIAVVADPNARLVGSTVGLQTQYGEQALMTLKCKELQRKLSSSTERIIAIKELLDLIEGDKIYAEEMYDDGAGF